MKIKLIETIETEIDLEVPAYFKNYSSYYKIDEEKITTVSSECIFFSKRKELSEDFFSKEVAKIVKYEKIPKEEFNVAARIIQDFINKTFSIEI
jgi:hypothetical protein